MAQFDFIYKTDLEMKACRARALEAHAFAEHARDADTASIWREIARSWDELLALREHMAATDARSAKTAADLVSFWRSQS
ncbi:MAG TPA: hypothetical protein VKB67_05855 [Rhizomicrobium sp.]|nr:hypothetical protein [Rhizomicrobium sp.]